MGLSSSQDVRKRSYCSRGEEFVECASLELPFSLPQVSAPKPSVLKSRLSNLFKARRNQTDIPEIHVGQELDVTSEARHTSHDSWTNERLVLPQPAHTLHGHESFEATESDGSLLIGRLA